MAFGVASSARQLSAGARIAGMIGLSAIIGLGIAGTQSLVGLVALIGVAMVVCLIYPYIGVIMLISVSFVLNGLVYSQLIPGNLQFIQDALALALLAAVLLKARLGHSPLLGRAVGARWVLMFLLVSVLGIALSGGSILAALVGLRNLWVFYPLALAASVLEWPDRQMRVIVTLILLLALVQVPIALAQFVFARTSSSGDPVGGTFGGFGSGVLTVLMIAVATVLIGWILHRASSVPRLVIATTLLMVPPALNETKVFFVAAPLIFGLILLPRMHRNIGAVLVAFVLLGALIAGVYQAYTTFYGARYRGRTTFEALLTQEASTQVAEGGVLNRLPSVVFAAGEISRSPTTLLFGHGAGSLTRSALAETSGELILEYGPLLRNTVFLVRLMLEYGLLGVVAFVGLLVSVFRVGMRLEREDTDPFWKGCGVGLQGIVLTMALLSVYTGTFLNDPLAVTFWTMSGLCAARLSTIRSSAGEGDVAEALSA